MELRVGTSVLGPGGRRYRVASIEKAFDPSQPRDERGRWSATGGAGGPGSSDLARYFAMVDEHAGGRSLEGYVLKNGREYEYSDGSFLGGEQHACYKNAALAALADDRLTYAEGFVSVHGVPIHHAWTVDEAGHVSDPTIGDGEGIQGYYGVPIRDDFLMETLRRKKTYGILTHDNIRSVLAAGPDVVVKRLAAEQRELLDALPPAEQRAVEVRERASTAAEGEKVDFGELASLAKAFDPSQPRDEQGQWTDTGGGKSAAVWLRRIEDRAIIDDVPLDRFKKDTLRWNAADNDQDNFYDDTKSTWEEGYPSEDALTWDKGLRQHAPNFEGGSLYRGLSDEELASFTDGSTVILTRPTSFTRYPKIAADFGNHVIEVKITRPNLGGAKDISDFIDKRASLAPDEIIVRPTQKFKVSKQGGKVVLTQT